MRKVKFNVIIKTGNKSGEILTEEACLVLLKSAFTFALGDAGRIGIKNYELTVTSPEVPQPPIVETAEIVAYENDLQSAITEIESDLTAGGYKIAH